MLRELFTLLIFSCCLASLGAQANVSVNVDPRVEDLLDLFEESSRSSTRVPGWRVQILATTDRARLETVETDFKVNYPNIPVDWVHDTPYYKLRAGAFSTKQGAERLKYTLTRQFEGVYLVRAEVKKSELLKMY